MSAPQEPTPVAPVISLVSPGTEQLLQKLREFNGAFFPACQLLNKSDVLDSGKLTQLALEGDKCVGAITCRREKDEHGNVAKVYINSIAVLESHRRLRTGTMLLERVTDFCSHDGIPELYLEVENENEGAINFFQKFGFKTSEMLKIMALVPEAQTIGISAPEEEETPGGGGEETVISLLSPEQKLSLVSPETEQRLQKLREFNGAFFAASQLPNKSDVRDSGKLTQLALGGDNCFGAITCRRDKDEHGNVAKVCIKSIAVLESHRRRGLGTMLLESVTDMCFKEAVPELYLKVGNDNEGAVKFFEKFGFKTLNISKIMTLVPEAQTIGISDE